jgi:beta-N-acetylhexosaminidase
MALGIYINAVVMAMMVFFSCQKSIEQGGQTGGKTNEPTEEVFTLKDYYSGNTDLESKVDLIYNGLSDEQRVAQMIISSAGSNGKSNNEVTSMINDGIIGGVIYLGGSKEGFTSLSTELQSIALKNAGYPLLISADGEPSLINRKITGIREFDKTNSITTTEEAGEIGGEIGGILKDMGVNHNFAPVCDYGFNKEIISSRSFGGSEAEAGKLAAAFIKATQEQGVIATAKHFPGHGNVSGDSHDKVVYINGSLDELPMFQDAINAGTISIMAGHIAIKNNPQYNTDGLPATMSRNIITGLLRDEMGFKGLVVTDGMNMGAVKIKNASLKAFLAGCDLIIMEPNERSLHSSIMNEISSSEDSRKQMEESVKRIIRAKVCLGLW